MFRKSLLTMALLAVFGFVSAQSLQFEWNGYVYADGEEIICNEADLDVDEVMVHLQVRNTTDQAIYVVLMKEEIQTVEGANNYFCWGECYSSTVAVSEPVYLGGNELTDEYMMSLHASFDPDWTFDPAQWIQGTQIVKYTIYDERNESDKTSVIVKFVSDADAVSENTIAMGHAYPNPASSTVSFDVNYNGVASVALYNLLGQEVLSQDVNGSKVVLPVSDLNEGIYFCNLKVNGQVVKTEKFIVKK